ncbi:MAG: hypothetical protein FJX46_07275 [Alphaproteobacteria bacterium]|nr:hypothetical protein [Alphaproteobacteria bacterium]
MRPLAARLLAPLLALALALAAPARAAEFHSAIEDLPLMPGLIEDKALTLSFDTPAGRIVEAGAFGRLERAAVEGFYAETLPGLGWQAAGAGAYRRGGETLRLDFASRAGTLTVRFAIKPE